MKRFVSTALAFALTLTMGVTALRAENIKVGAILAVTGGQSFLGAPEAKTLEMMVAEKNAAGGINGNKIDLLIKDSAGDPEKAISFAKQLIEEEKVFAIIGPSSSGETMKIKDIAEQGKTILLSCAAAEVIVNPVAKYVFKTPQKDSFAVQMIFKEMNKMKISKIAVVADNTGFGKAGKEQLEKIAPDFGIQILAGEVYDKAATDLSALVAKLMSDKEIQAVINWSVVPAQAIVAKNMRQAGWQVPLFQSHGFGNIKYAQAAGAAARSASPTLPPVGHEGRVDVDAAARSIFPAGRLLVADTLAANHPQKSLLAKYKKDYESKYQEDVSTFGGHAYDALAILVEGIRLAGPDREKVRDTIENLKGFAGTGGIFNFSPEDHNGLAIDAFEMLTVKDGKFVMYQ